MNNNPDNNHSKYFVFLDNLWNEPLKYTGYYLANYLSIKNQVIVIEYPSFRNFIKILLKKQPISESINNNLSIIHTIAILPKGHTFSLINFLNYFITFFLTKKFFGEKLKSHKIIISFTPEIYIFNKYFKTQNIYYYVKDDYTYYSIWNGLVSKMNFKFLEDKMIKKCKKIIVGSIMLYRKYQKLSNNVIYFPNPSYISPFINKIRPIKHNDYIDINRIPKPIIGFIGSVNDRLDFNLIDKLLRKYYTYSFVFIGPIHSSVRVKINDLMKRNNIFFLGLKSMDELPYYLDKFKVCIIPYFINEFDRMCFPIKTYQYLAMGKPVVTTALPSIKHLADKSLIYWANNTKEFLKYTDMAINERYNIKQVKQQINEAKKNSWNIKITEFIKLVNEK